MQKLEIGQRVNEYWCGDGVVTGISDDEKYYQVDWDSGLSNEGIGGYARWILRPIENEKAA
jgi:hypothetical protein